MENAIFFERKEVYKISYVKYKYFVILLGGQYLFEILNTSSTVKTSENVVKGWCLYKSLNQRVTISFRRKEGCKVSCVKMFVWLIYLEVSFYLKYYTLHSLLSTVKTWLREIFGKTIAMERETFARKQRGIKVSCVKILTFC